MPSEASSAAGGPSPRQEKGWFSALSVYRDRRILVILLMGFSSGLPLLLTLSTLSYWLAKVGVDKTAIGLFALVGLPYSFKFLWAPAIDHLPVPVLGRLLGHRRAWALVTQAGLILSIVAMGTSDPAVDPWATAVFALAVAFFSASQDIVLDAYRIEVLDESEQGAGAAAIQAGYRVGLLAAGAGAIAFSDFFGWFWIFVGLAVLVLVGVVAVLLGPEPQVQRGQRETEGASKSGQEWIRDAVISPFTDFLKRRGWWVILCFVLLYKFGDAIGGVMANPFYIEIGFTGVEIASVSKVFGMLATLAGVFAGGALVARYGIFKALVIGGILQALTNLLFALQAVVGHDIVMLAVVIGADNFTGGLGSAAFVAYLSMLCNTAFTGTQYALLTSFMAFGRTLLSSGGGWLADQMDWVAFFVLTTGLAIPGLVILWWMIRALPLAEQTGGRSA